jgi:hypothetical protein
MLGMPQWTQGTYTVCYDTAEGTTTKEDFHSSIAGQTVHWHTKPRYNTKGEKAIHQRLKKKLEERKNKEQK